VRRVRNGEEFKLEYRRIFRRYKESSIEQMVQLRCQYSSTLDNKADMISEKDLLEAHVRRYFIDDLLKALNWQILTDDESQSQLIPEVPIKSDQKGSIRFLDYLGLEQGTQKPLLVVETKRPMSPLPKSKKAYQSYEEIIAGGLGGETLGKEWDEWLHTLRDYICSISNKSDFIPRRAVLTDSNWLILFLDPEDAFLPNGECNPSKILVFINRDEIEQKLSEIFIRLEYQIVLGEAPPLTLGELRFHFSGNDVYKVMHGLKLVYFERPPILYSMASPDINIAPIIFIKSKFGAWFQIESPSETNQFKLPYNYNELDNHLIDIENAANKLLEDINKLLNIKILPTSVLEYYQDNDSFVFLKGVREKKYSYDNRSSEYIIVTGNNTHYILLNKTVSDCPHHSWMESQKLGSANLETLVMKRRTVSPRSFFINEEKHFCAHFEVTTAKASMLTNVNKAWCGNRSGKEGQAFCEIASFESFLCCRTCVFEQVCINSKVFILPCLK
jgi:hypothetical protein